MSRHLTVAGLLFAVLGAAPAYAQVNIDEGKTPAHIFASDCSVCHKSPRGLASGRDMGGLTGFLSEHYASSRQEAAALAAYVLANGGNAKPAAEARGPAKPAKPSAGRPGEPKPATAEVRRPEKPEREAARKPKLKRPLDGRPVAERKPGESAAAARRESKRHRATTERRPQSAEAELPGRDAAPGSKVEPKPQPRVGLKPEPKREPKPEPKTATPVAPVAAPPAPPSPPTEAARPVEPVHPVATGQETPTTPVVQPVARATITPPPEAANSATKKPAAARDNIPD